MTDLLDLVYEAHGGLERWQRLKQVKFTGAAAGILPWPRPDFLADFTATIDPQAQNVVVDRFGAPGRRARYTPDRVDILDGSGTVVGGRDEPRRAFDDYSGGELWSETQAAYFAGYAFWTYLTVPFTLAWDGVRSTEIEPWQENGEQWRRLRVAFPADIVTHNSVQTLYFGDDFLLRRHDYSPDLLGNPLTAHYPAEYRTFDGFAFPTRRHMVHREADDSTSGGTLITLDIHSVTCRGEGA
ncbi:hypothetical protein [Streptomyces sp. KS_5]|uniref:hypothetical protein n=1 Tax=Streptomyces sp. KS_5 TaxID=1881018 RepID=UPI0008994025|nr:hypothetical protein [Streptomyces sp. KS_5]SEE35131.1 hypothetical protein SAMN05428938_7957 [Streptomyces sp. KS_5]